MNERAKRFVAVEREYFEDLVAEARSKFESRRNRRAAKRTAAVHGKQKPAATAQA
jgi:hypothetical protein